MNWNEVMVWGISGVVLAVLISLLRKKGKIGRLPGIILFLVVIIGGNILWNAVIKPRVMGESEEQKIDQALAELPLYGTIKAQEPALYAQIPSNILKMQKDGKPQQEAIDTVKPMVSELLSKRIAHAPDAAVNAAMQVNLEEMQTLLARKDGTCFKFLYPQVSGGVNTAEVLPNGHPGWSIGFRFSNVYTCPSASARSQIRCNVSRARCSIPGAKAPICGRGMPLSPSPVPCRFSRCTPSRLPICAVCFTDASSIAQPSGSVSRPSR